MKENDKKTDKEDKRFFIGAAYAGGDGDLLHLSEGISNDLAYSVMLTEEIK